MKISMKLLVIALVVTSMALAPSLIINKSVEAASHSCEEKGKSKDWIAGCKDGWSQHDKCLGGDPDDGKSQAYYSGFFAGWKKGHCNK